MKAENIFTNQVRIQKNWIFQGSIEDIEKKESSSDTRNLF